MSKRDIPTQFGIFYPTGHIVVAFPHEENARKVQQDLFAGGFSESECRFFPTEEVKAQAQRHIHNAGFLGMLGSSDEMEQAHIEAANRGCVFLKIYAPSDADADRVMRVVRRVPFDLAHRYHSLAIEVLK